MPKLAKHKTLTRQWLMLKFVPTRSPGISSASLQAKLEEAGYPVTKRTVERDMGELADLFEIAVNDSGTPYRWHWPAGREPGFAGLTVAEAVSLKLVEEHLRGALPRALIAALESRFHKAGEFLAALAGNHLASWPERVASVSPVMPLLPPAIDPAILETVQQAVLQGRRLDAIYRSRSGGKEVPHILHPLALVQSGPVTYLVATSGDYEVPRSYALQRFLSASLREEAVIRPKGFRLKDYLKSGALQFGSAEPIVLEARLSETVARYLAETRLSADQTIDRRDDGEILLKATVRDTWQLRFWLLSHGAGIVVLKPTGLRREILQALEEAVRAYAEAPPATKK